VVLPRACTAVWIGTHAVWCGYLTETSQDHIQHGFEGAQVCRGQTGEERAGQCMRTSLHARHLGLAAPRETDNGRAAVSRMRFTRDQAARFERVYQIGDIPRRAAQKLAELALRPLRPTLQLPEDFSPGWRETAFRQARVHACGQHHASTLAGTRVVLRVQIRAVTALLGWCVVAAIVGQRASGSLWGFPLADLVWWFDVVMLAVGLASTALAMVLGTPGCEIGVLRELAACFRRGPAPSAEASPCILGLHALDEWERRRTAPRSVADSSAQ
jgi:hypothetical protein